MVRRGVSLENELWEVAERDAGCRKYFGINSYSNSIFEQSRKVGNALRFFFVFIPFVSYYDPGCFLVTQN